MELEGPEFSRMVREEYIYAIEMACGIHNPATDWEGFRDTLFDYLQRVFGLPLEHERLLIWVSRRPRLGPRHVQQADSHLQITYSELTRPADPSPETGRSSTESPYHG